ncbi:MAG: penicillin-binding protein 2, partial [Chroococcales cyanobacterium]
MTLLQPLPQAKSGRNATSRTVGQQFQSIVVMLIVSLVLLGGIGSRLFYLQLVQGKTYEALAQNNRIRIIPKQPVRGNIFDRKQRLLATSRLSHSLFVWPTAPQQPYWPKTVAKVSEILNLPEEDIEALVAQADVHSSTLVRIARDLTPAQITAVEEYRAELQGIEIDIEPVRYYPNGELAAHVLGYTGELSPEALEKRQKEGYRLGD